MGYTLNSHICGLKDRIMRHYCSHFRIVVEIVQIIPVKEKKKMY